ncbi:MAG: hypothetical protein ACR2MY_14975 [Candidatus Dormibacteria bacterium]
MSELNPEDIRPLHPVRSAVPFKVWAKINGTYPDGGMADAVRSKDRLLLHVGPTHPIGSDGLPGHTVSVEMGPVLSNFADMATTLEMALVMDGEVDPCGAALHRAGTVIGICQRPPDHNGDHLDAGNAQELENWPPRSLIRWRAGVTEFERYDPVKPGTWTWDDDDDPAPPDLSVPFTGQLGEGVRRLSGRKWQNRRLLFEVPLPPLEEFLSRRRDVDPLRLFMTWLGRQIGGVPAGRLLDSARVFLWQRDLERLLEIEGFWAERLTGDPTAAWMEVFNLTPVCFDGRRMRQSAWARPSHAYVAEGILRRGS